MATPFRLRRSISYAPRPHFVIRVGQCVFSFRVQSMGGEVFFQSGRIASTPVEKYVVLDVAMTFLGTLLN